MKKLLCLSAVALLLTGCSNHDLEEFRGENPNEEKTVKANDFNFSTVSEVRLNVDYSACAPQGAVFFSVYSENPMNGDEMDETISPIYSGYTDAKGRFNKNVTLPSFADQLYVYSGDFFVANDVATAKVTSGSASVVFDAAPAAARARRAHTATNGPQTQSLATLYQLSNLVDWRTGDDLGQQIYKPWHTPLGTWDSQTGRPSYLMTAADEAYSRLTITDEEMKGIHQSIAGALTRKQTCKMEYRQSADLTLKEPSEVAVTFVGSNTCWNNTIGYYYYMDGQEPTNFEDLNVIMMFPNTQDGLSQFMKSKGNNYYGNIALDRGDAVKLMYYPNIASGSYEGATSVFPAGMKIGFLLKSNGWAMQKDQGDKKFHNSYLGEMKGGATISRQYNCWAASTDGMSYCEANAEQNAADPGAVGKSNPNHVSRTAKFAYENAQGQQYAIVTFEDAANDEDYSDVVLAMKPVGVFQPLPAVAPRESTTKGVYAFEDLWPDKGDYDMNDAVVDFKENRVFTMSESVGEYRITKQTFSLTTYRNYVEAKNGLALTLNTPVTPSNIAMKKILKDSNEAVDAQFTVEDNVYLLVANMKDEINATYILELTYDQGIDESKAANVKPFIYRNVADNKRWEVHIPMEAPTAKMEMSYFGTGDDASDPDNNLFYVRTGDYPFAFFLSGVDVSVFKKTILVGDMWKKAGNESRPIDEFFPDFLEWSQSKGTKKKDWYKHPAEN